MTTPRHRASMWFPLGHIAITLPERLIGSTQFVGNYAFSRAPQGNLSSSALLTLSLSTRSSSLSTSPRLATQLIV